MTDGQASACACVQGPGRAGGWARALYPHTKVNQQTAQKRWKVMLHAIGTERGREEEEDQLNASLVSFSTTFGLSTMIFHLLAPQCPFHRLSLAHDDLAWRTNSAGLSLSLSLDTTILAAEKLLLKLPPRPEDMVAAYTLLATWTNRARVPYPGEREEDLIIGERTSELSWWNPAEGENRHYEELKIATSGDFLNASLLSATWQRENELLPSLSTWNGSGGAFGIIKCDRRRSEEDKWSHWNGGRRGAERNERVDLGMEEMCACA